MLPWNGLLDRSYGWSYAITILTRLLAVATLSVGDNAYAAQKKAGILQDKTEALLKGGYIALSGDDAVGFLVGNSVLIKKTDAPKGFPAGDNDQRYYFSDRHRAYQCVGDDCWTESWKVEGKEICFEFPEQCDDADHRYYVAPRLFKAPRPDERTGRIGIYLTYKSNLHAVVRGNATIAPLFEPSRVSKMIEVSSADFSREIEASSKFSGGDKNVPVKGAQAISLLIGNTFISGETAIDEKGDVHLCPDQGYYYSPDGRVITFNCHHWPDNWEMGVSHWRVNAGKFCLEDLTDKRSFGCGDRFETVYLTASDKHDVWLVITEGFPRKIFGYTGNVFDFK